MLKLTGSTMRRLLLALATAVQCGCATPYRPLDVGARVPDGFFETQLSPTTYEVHFDGNNASSRERVDDFALLRAADLCLQAGFRYFVITSSWRGTNFARYLESPEILISSPANVFGLTAEGVSTLTVRGAPRATYTRPRQILVVGFLAEPSADSGLVFDAVLLRDTIRSKYELDSVNAREDSRG